MTSPVSPTPKDTEAEEARRAAMRRTLEDAVWPFLAHTPAKPDVFWGQMVDSVLRTARAVLAASPAVSGGERRERKRRPYGGGWAYEPEPASPAVTAAEDETRGKCSQCLITYAIRSDGNVRHHRHISGSVCTGSGRPPAVTAVPAEPGED